MNADASEVDALGSGSFGTGGRISELSLEARMAVIGIAGLPGSGKSALMRELQKQGYSRYDDINKNWADNLWRARDEARLGKNLAISDIMFCHQSFREKLDKELGLPAQWIFFENDAWQCAKNCLWRFMFEKPDRPLVRELEHIQDLSRIYTPHGEVRPVVRADEHCRLDGNPERRI